MELPVMVTVAIAGVPMVAPAPAADRATVNDLLPEKGAALLTVTVNDFEVVSPPLQLNVPVAEV